ncbi:endonuclease [Microvirga tunisiensis]|uniref:Endonuclease n=1 Tax=Pannonibacter tanglangensis TaxID=2750084 RepID=A0A7X5F610_9HYPH|nr:endonuclease/exonuclease/phosphatase family protein [Pannonibacter sp. XCT-53]NBN80368.1 endonuclease [Pannonibacter sp. XCT-53]
MRIATYNLESFGAETDDPARLVPRISALRPRLVALSADVLCLQEINAQKPPGATLRQHLALEQLLAGTPYADFPVVTSLRADGHGPADRHNLAVVSRHPILRAETLWNTRVMPPLWRPQTADPPVAAPLPILFDRPLLAVTIALPDGRPLHVLCLHLRAPIAAPVAGGKLAADRWGSSAAWAEGYFLAAVKQVAQALEARLWVEERLAADPDALIALAGDFNADLSSAALRLLAAGADDTGNPDLAGRSLSALDGVRPDGRRGTVLHGGRFQTLDHILVSPALRQLAIQVEVHNAGLPDEVFAAGGTAASYHAAVTADFAFDRATG